jgi:hypothetical protein
MYKTIVKIMVITLLAILQFALFSKLTLFGVFPNIIIILAIALLFRGHFQDSFLVAAIGGLMMDIISPLRFGIYTFLIIVILLLINFVILKFLPTPNLIASFFIFAGAFLFIDLSLALFTLLWPGWSLAIDAIINGFWGALIYWLLGKISYPENEIRVV